MGAVAEAYGRRGARDLLHRHHMLKVAEAEAPIVFLDGHAVQAQLAHLGPKLAREGVGLVDGGGDRGDLVGGEAGRGLADGVGGLAEAEFQAGSVVRDHAAGLSMGRRGPRAWPWG